MALESFNDLKESSKLPIEMQELIVRRAALIMQNSPETAQGSNPAVRLARIAMMLTAKAHQNPNVLEKWKSEDKAAGDIGHVKGVSGTGRKNERKISKGELTRRQLLAASMGMWTGIGIASFMGFTNESDLKKWANLPGDEKAAALIQKMQDIKEWDISDPEKANNQLIEFIMRTQNPGRKPGDEVNPESSFP